MKNAVKEKLARGELAASMTVRLVSGVEIVRIAKPRASTRSTSTSSTRAYAGPPSQISVMALEAGIPALVRVPASTPEYISRVLDGGALGVIAPGVQTRRRRRARSSPRRSIRRSAAAASPPASRTSASAACRPRSADGAERGDLGVVQLESAAGLAAIEEIVAVEGVDMVLIGTNDLLADFGLAGEYDHPKLRRPTNAPSLPAAGTASTSASAAWARGPTWSSSSSGSARAMFRPATISRFLLAECTRRARQVKELNF